MAGGLIRSNVNVVTWKSDVGDHLRIHCKEFGGSSTAVAYTNDMQKSRVLKCTWEKLYERLANLSVPSIDCEL